MSTPLARIRTAVKSWLYGADAPWYLGSTGIVAAGLHTSTIDYRAEAGSPDANAIVVACLNWVATTFPEAPVQVQRRQPGRGPYAPARWPARRPLPRRARRRGRKSSLGVPFPRSKRR